MRYFAALWLALIGGLFATGSVAADSTPSAVVDSFHKALRLNQPEKAVGLLSLDALIYEQGFSEISRDEWIQQQLGPAIAFAGDSDRRVVRRSSRISGDAAWVMSSTQTMVKLPERELVFNGGETAILQKEGDVWKIVHLHWSAHEAEQAETANTGE